MSRRLIVVVDSKMWLKKNSIFKNKHLIFFLPTQSGIAIFHSYLALIIGLCSAAFYRSRHMSHTRIQEGFKLFLSWKSVICPQHDNKAYQ